MDKNQCKISVSSVIAKYRDRIDNPNSEVATSMFEDPIVNYKEYVESSKYLNSSIKLTDRQLNAAYAVLYGCLYREYDEKLEKKEVSINIFENTQYPMAMLLWGKGSGKDLIGSTVISYIRYFCLDCKDPQTLLNLDNTDTIDIINIAFSAHQANVVFFEKLKQLTKRDAWLRDKFHIRESGLIQSKPTDIEELSEVRITQNAILFPKLVRCFSRHSEQESTEGLNLIAFILDELSAFKDKTKTRNADKIYNMCITSAESRFGQRYKSFALTFPRYEDDPGEKLYKLSQKDLHIYGDKGCTWEIKDVVYKNSKTFEFEDFEVDAEGISRRIVYNIPIEFKGHFKRNPTDAKMRYMCRPPKVESPFVEYPRRVDMCINKLRLPILETNAWIDQVTVRGEVFNQIKRKIVKWNIELSPFDHIITIDLGLKNDRAALSICHREENRLVDDFSTVWFPNKEREIVVDFANVEEFINEVKNKIRIIGVFFDQWNSAFLIQNLRNIGIMSKDYRLGFQDYKNMLDMIYSYNIDFYITNDKDMVQLETKMLSSSELLISEIKKLQLLKAKVDHPEEGSKDIVDTIVGAIKVLFAEEPKNTDTEGGEIIEENLMTEGGVTIR